MAGTGTGRIDLFDIIFLFIPIAGLVSICVFLFFSFSGIKGSDYKLITGLKIEQAKTKTMTIELNRKLDVMMDDFDAYRDSVKLKLDWIEEQKGYESKEYKAIPKNSKKRGKERTR